MDFKGKIVLVVGLARTGVSTVEFLVREGAEVIATDIRSRGELDPGFLRVADLPVRWSLGGHREEDFRSADLIVMSPGVPLELPELSAAREEGKEIIAEIELAHRAIRDVGSRGEIIAVTGTNGKTTVTTLLGEVIAGEGKRVFVGGNVGNPLIEAVPGALDVDYFVVEVSSFQLEAISSFRPRIAVLLNVTDDHLDRYPSFTEYAEAKAHLLDYQTPEDWVVANREDPVVENIIHRGKAQICHFSYWNEVARGAFFHTRPDDSTEVIFRNGKGEWHGPLGRLRVRGVHYQENLLAVLTAGSILNFDRERILARGREFPGLPHRNELVATWNNIQFVDDSKATNVGAVGRALEGFPPQSVILIAGGKDKGGDYGVINDLIRDRVKHLLLIGESQDIIATAWGGLVPHQKMGELSRAVVAAVEIAGPGDVVLLSPACSSFDQFQDYTERGNVFRREVRKVTNG